jgi:cell division septum initiation protein DivIVA
MLENVKDRIRQLIAAYESERMENKGLHTELEQTRLQNETYRKQIIELERQIDNLKLTEAFMAGGADTSAAKKKIDRLMKEIDRCISLMEG